jgi:hypothetical protein
MKPPSSSSRPSFWVDFLEAQKVWPYRRKKSAGVAKYGFAGPQSTGSANADHHADLGALPGWPSKNEKWWERLNRKRRTVAAQASLAIATFNLLNESTEAMRERTIVRRTSI